MNTNERLTGRDGYDCSESYTALAVIGLILASPLIALFMIFVWPYIEAVGYVKGWWWR